MAKRKKKINIIFVISIILLGIFLANYSQIFKGGNLFSTVPIDCSGGDLCKQSVSPYVCPLDVDFCQVKGEIDCNSKTSEQNVVFRSDGAYGKETSFYLAEFSGALRLYTYEGVQVSNSVCTSQNTLYTDGSNRIIKYNNDVYVCYPGGTIGTIIARSYTPSGGLVDDTPQRDCDPNNHEICVGDTPYSCSSELRVLKSDQTLKSSENIEYSDTTSGSKQSSQYQLMKGEKVELFGGSYSNSRIYYNTFRIEETCTINYCEAGGIRKCVNGKPDEFVSCDYGCSSGVCVNPYDFNLKVRDSKGFEKTVFGKNDEIKIYATISTPSNINGQITLDIRENNVQGSSFLTQTKQFTANSNTIFDVQLPLTGTYYLVFLIDYPQLDEPDIYGNDLNELKNIEIVEDFSGKLRVSQELGGVINSNKFYTGYPIKIEYIFKEPGDTPVLPDSASVTYQIGSGSKVSLNNPQISQDDFAGYYIYYFTPTTSGAYKFEGTATKGTFVTPIDVEGAFPIERDSIVIEYDLAYNPVINNKLYSNILKFTTKNRNKELIETNNKVFVKINGVNSGELDVKGSDGQYSVDYNFPTTRADYLFTIQSSSNGSLTSGELSTELISSGDQEDTFCQIDSECGFLSVCTDGGCQTNVNLIVIMVFGLFGVLLVSYLVYRFIKNKKQNPNFGGDFNL